MELIDTRQPIRKRKERKEQREEPEDSEERASCRRRRHLDSQLPSFFNRPAKGHSSCLKYPVPRKDPRKGRRNPPKKGGNTTLQRVLLQRRRCPDAQKIQILGRNRIRLAHDSRHQHPCPSVCHRSPSSPSSSSSSSLGRPSQAIKTRTAPTREPFSEGPVCCARHQSASFTPHV